MPNTNIPGAWPASKILETLSLKSAQSAMRGKPCPVAMLVVARIEALETK